MFRLEVKHPQVLVVVELGLGGTGKLTPKHPQLPTSLSQGYGLQHTTLTIVTHVRNKP